MDLIREERTIDCVTYRGMDRNVLIVDVFDETQGGEQQVSYKNGWGFTFRE